MTVEYARRLELVELALDRTADPLQWPLGIDFQPLAGSDYLDAWRRLAAKIRGGHAHRQAVVYLHLPFCARVCTYCLLSSTRVPGRASLGEYVESVVRHAEMLEPVAQGISFSTLHVGGGTPTLLKEKELETVLAATARFKRTDSGDAGMEAHPATTTPAKMEIARRYGIKRISFGVESFTTKVLRAVDRGDQTTARVQAAVGFARGAGLKVNLDLLAGLPGETIESFSESVREALRLKPDSLSVNRFLLENSALGAQSHEWQDTSAVEMLERADAIIRETRPPRWPARRPKSFGYGTQYVWDRSESARPYFQDDMIGATSTFALGHGGMAHLHGLGFAIGAGDHTNFVASIAGGKPPEMLFAPISLKFEMALHVAERAYRGQLTASEFQKIFGVELDGVLGRELRFLVDRRLLEANGGALLKGPSRSFQVTHLLTFLLHDSAALERMLNAGGKPGATSVRAQYDAIPVEMPPSVLWCRIAMRASATMKRSRRLPVVA